MEKKFELVFERVIGHEGKYQNDYNDRGNWTTGVVGKGELKGTKFGISAMSYPKVDIKNLTVPQARAIYERDFWEKPKINLLPFEMAFQVFDYSVNSGSSKAIKDLQTILGVTSDGIIGNNTINRANDASKNIDLRNDVLIKLNAMRLRYITTISTFSTYGKGWVKRIAENLEYATKDN